jgi:hypothetical protein
MTNFTGLKVNFPSQVWAEVAAFACHNLQRTFSDDQVMLLCKNLNAWLMDFADNHDLSEQQMFDLIAFFISAQVIQPAEAP